MAAPHWLVEPVRGSTPLWKVAFLYSFLGGAVLQILANILAPTTQAGQRALNLAALAYGTYVTVAMYRCAMNCPWPTFGRMVQLCAAVSLLFVPFVVYFILTHEVILEY